MIITIDGPAGSGKSAVAGRLARRLKISHLDTGAMYRAVALFALENQLLENPEALAHACASLNLSFDWSQPAAPVMLNGRNVADLIREPRVTAVTYVAADNLGVRKNLVHRQREIAREREALVSEGRDQSSVVFPDADFKFYLDAAPEARARRRILQMQKKGMKPDSEKVLAEILERDARDRGRPVGGLLLTDDAIHIDTTPLDLNQVVDTLFAIVTGPGKKA